MASRPSQPTHCSPTHFANHPASGTCLSQGDIAALASHLLKNKPNKQLAKKSDLLAALHYTLGTRPGDEERWLTLPAVTSKPALRARLEAAFRPAHPDAWLKNPRAWLSNLDILAVMTQYQTLLMPTHAFRFLGVVPRDFEAPASPNATTCVTDAICRVHVRDLRAQGVRQLGIVFNLDKHTGNGSHWTAMFVGLDPASRPADRYGAFYYDSLARRPPAEMQKFAERMRAESGDGEGFPIRFNDVRKQFANTECGIYSMFFIIACVQSGRSIADICKRLVRGDSEMHRLRSIMFRPPPSAPSHSHSNSAKGARQSRARTNRGTT
jgi:hypothetical protein